MRVMLESSFFITAKNVLLCYAKCVLAHITMDKQKEDGAQDTFNSTILIIYSEALKAKYYNRVYK